MNQEVRRYQTTEGIKQIVIGIQELRVRREIEREYFLNKRNPQVDYLAHAKQSAKHELLNHISDFILVKEIADGFYLEAELHLPYVRDSKIKELESTVLARECKINVMRLREKHLISKIKLLERPWWKKLFKIDE